MTYVAYQYLDKRSAPERIADAVAAYVERYKHQPTQLLVHESDLAVQVRGLQVETRPWVQRNMYMLGG